jgi:ABC-type lipoprotein release transport system permease subunit
MTALRLAMRNLLGAGLRTWLNAFVLSLAMVVAVWHQGVLNGWSRRARRETIAWEIGGGQWWHAGYDPYDPFTWSDAHAPLPAPLARQVAEGDAVAVLVAQAAMYPEGRLRSVLLKGITVSQTLLRLPTGALEATADGDDIPVLLGRRMARQLDLAQGDLVTLRWRDARGMFDAAEARVAAVFDTDVPGVDLNQAWLPLPRLQRMLGLEQHASLVTVRRAPPDTGAAAPGAWTWHGHDDLLAELDRMIRQKSVGGMVLYVILLLLALVALFDTQVLSVFRRRREIGMHVALGLTPGDVVRMFTLEGALHTAFALVLGAAYGIPLLVWQARTGLPMPEGFDEYGFAVASRLYPDYSLAWLATALAAMTVAAVLVSYLPARKLARLRPTDALRGRLT